MSRRHFAPGILALTVTIGPVIATMSGVALAQSPSIVGRALDGIGQPIPGVFVTALPQSGGIARRATTGDDGAYQFQTLPDGTYRVDFELQGFDMSRRNHVRVRVGTTAYADATLSVSAICECVNSGPQTGLRERAGQVVDDFGRPLAHARLQIVSPMRREEAYANGEGRFQVRLPVNETWPLMASDSGFSATTEQVSGVVDGPIVMALRRADSPRLPDTERFTRWCRCPGDLFTHEGR